MAKQAKANRDDDSVEYEESLVTMARGLAKIVVVHDLSELIVDTKETTITVRRAHAHAAPAEHRAPPPIAHAPVVHHAVSAAVHAPAPAVSPPPPEKPAEPDKAHVVTSPFVGTFYRKPSPDSTAYVSMGDRVDKGQVLCIVEAMKLMNEIEADVAGTIVGILVEDGVPVEYGQPLFKIQT